MQRMTKHHLKTPKLTIAMFLAVRGSTASISDAKVWTLFQLLIAAGFAVTDEKNQLIGCIDSFMPPLNDVTRC